MIIPLLGLGACAAKLTPLQERTWDAFKDCQRPAPSAILQQISEEGGISYTPREGPAGAASALDDHAQLALTHVCVL
jgi:hypothetical protein